MSYAQLKRSRIAPEDVHTGPEDQAQRRRTSLTGWFDAIFADGGRPTGAKLSVPAGTRHPSRGLDARQERFSHPEALHRSNPEERDEAFHGDRSPGDTPGHLDRRRRDLRNRSHGYRDETREARWVPEMDARADDRLENMELQIEQTTELFERRCAKTQKTADAALTAVRDLVESSETQHEAQRAAFDQLFDRLNNFERHFATRPPDDNLKPIRRALARLEAGLDSATRGRRSDSDSCADAPAHRSHPALHNVSSASNGLEPILPAPTMAVATQADDVRRLEEKLNSVLQAILSKPHVPPTPEYAPRAEASEQRRENTVQKSDHRWVSEATVSVLQSKRPRPPNGPGSLLLLKSEVAALSQTLDDVRREIRERENPIQVERTGTEPYRGSTDTKSHPGEAVSQESIAALEVALQSLKAELESAKRRGKPDDANPS